MICANIYATPFRGMLGLTTPSRRLFMNFDETRKLGRRRERVKIHGKWAFRSTHAQTPNLKRKKGSNAVQYLSSFHSLLSHSIYSDHLHTTELQIHPHSNSQLLSRNGLLEVTLKQSVMAFLSPNWRNGKFYQWKEDNHYNQEMQ